MEENNMPNQITESELESEAKKQEKKIGSSKMGGKGNTNNRVGLLMILGVVLLIATLIWYIYNLYLMQLDNTQKNFMNKINNVVNKDKMDEKPVSEKTDVELLDELTNDVEEDISKLEGEIDAMDAELNELENQQLN